MDSLSTESRLTTETRGIGSFRRSHSSRWSSGAGPSQTSAPLRRPRRAFERAAPRWDDGRTASARRRPPREGHAHTGRKDEVAAAGCHGRRARRRLDCRRGPRAGRRRHRAPPGTDEHDCCVYRREYLRVLWHTRHHVRCERECPRSLRRCHDGSWLRALR